MRGYFILFIVYTLKSHISLKRINKKEIKNFSEIEQVSVYSFVCAVCSSSNVRYAFEASYAFLAGKF